MLSSLLLLLNLIPSCPTDGILTSRYGYRRHPIERRRKFHKGIDIGAKEGTPVHAAWGGQVVKAPRRSRGFGKLLLIRSGELLVLYAHLSSREVKKGDRIEAGEIIGAVGQTGVATGPHLHLGMFRGRRHVNPGIVMMQCYEK